MHGNTDDDVNAEPDTDQCASSKLGTHAFTNYGSVARCHTHNNSIQAYSYLGIGRVQGMSSPSISHSLQQIALGQVHRCPVAVQHCRKGWRRRRRCVECLSVLLQRRAVILLLHGPAGADMLADAVSCRWPIDLMFAQGPDGCAGRGQVVMCSSLGQMHDTQ